MKSYYFIIAVVNGSGCVRKVDESNLKTSKKMLVDHSGNVPVNSPREYVALTGGTSGWSLL